MTILTWVSSIIGTSLVDVSRVLVDFLFAYLLLYGAIKIVFLNQRTRAVGAGFAVVLVVWLLTQGMQLQLMERIAGPLMIFAGVIAVLLFQEELRYLLMQMTDVFRRLRDDVEIRQALLRIVSPKRVIEGGSAVPVQAGGMRQRIGRAWEQFRDIFADTAFTAKDQSQSAVLMNAIEQLSKLELGGLIVVDREDDLSHHVSDGVALNAALSERLLHAIFIPQAQNPLHDGASVVRGMTLVKAGCILPLSSNPEIPLSFGTRHRAGIGLSEVSRAVVIVVSEETGGCTICYRGGWKKFERELNGPLPMTGIKAYYAKVTKSSPKDEEKELSDTSKPWLAKKFSLQRVLQVVGFFAVLALTIGVWRNSADFAEEATTVISLPIEYPMESGFVLMDGPRSVELEIKGPKGRVDSLPRNIADERIKSRLTPCFRATLGAPSCEERAHRVYDNELVSMQVKDFERRHRVEVVSGHENIRVSIDELVSRSVPVLPVITGTQHPDAIRENARVSPERVDVKVPSRSRLTTIYTEEVWIEGARETVERSVALVAPEDVQYFDFVGVNTARVEIAMTLRRVPVVLPPVRVDVVGVPRGYDYEVSPQLASVMAEGPAGAMVSDRASVVRLNIANDERLSREVLEKAPDRIELSGISALLAEAVLGLRSEFTATQISPMEFTVILTRKGVTP